LEHDDLLELFGYDEEQGFSRIVLEQGTEIEIPIEDEQGVTFWIASEVSICHEGSLNFRAEFPSRTLDTGIWKQTRSRADMDVTWLLPPALRRRQTAVHDTQYTGDTHNGTTLEPAHIGLDSNLEGHGLTGTTWRWTPSRTGYMDGE